MKLWKPENGRGWVVEFLNVRIASIVLIIAAIAGAVVTCVNPDSLPFTQYLKDISIAFGALGIAHGIDANSKP